MSAKNVSADVSVASDYRFRGYSRSGRDPVLQASIDAERPIDQKTSVFAGGVTYVFPRTPRYGYNEVDIYGGLQRDIGAVSLSIGTRAYLFTTVSSRSYYEVFGSGRTTYGPITAKLGFAIAPERSDYGHRRSVYVYSDLDAVIPRTPITLGAHLGREAASGADEKLDWEFSATYVRSPFDVSLAYVDTNRFLPFYDGLRAGNTAGATLVVRLRGSF